LKKHPTAETVINMMQSLFEVGEFSPECVVVTLIYINRLKAKTKIPFEQMNWRPIVLCAILLSQKIWDDSKLENREFSFMYPFFSLEEINTLEKHFV
jgi:hypothetical protein